jgi:hypothetical protein
MKVFRVLGLGLVLSIPPLFLQAASVKAATFNFLSGTSSNDSIKSFLDSGVNLDVSSSNSTGNNPNTINSPGNPPLTGLCVFAVVGNGLGRCGYGATSPTNGISSFQLKFDKPVEITTFDVSAFDTLSSGSIKFSLDNSIFNSVNVTGTGTQALANRFFAAANQTIYVQTTGTVSGSTGGLIRLGSLTAVEQAQTPAPLPILGAALGFRVSRRLRKRVDLAAR